MRRPREVIAAEQYWAGGYWDSWGVGHRGIWTELIPSGAPMVFGAAAVASRPAQEYKQHHALLSGIVTLGGQQCRGEW